MEFLFLNWKDVKNPDVGGAEVIAFEFAKRLVKDGHKVVFFSRSFLNCLEQETIDGVNVIRRGGKLGVYLQAFLYYKNLKIKPDKAIDMINTICWQTPLYIPKEKRIAYVNQLAKEVFFFELSKPFSYIVYLLEKFQYFSYRNTKFLCYSDSTKKDLEEFGMNGKNIRIFPLGLDHSRYKEAVKKSSYPLFIYVGRLVKMKRVDLCLKSFKEVVEKYKNSKFAVVGNGPDEERLRNITKNLKLTKNVIFVNKNNFFLKKHKLDQKIKLMQEAWCLLLPSVKEGWGMVVTEAAACGTPSIVSNVTGLRDSVIKDKTGLILSENPSVKELSDAIIKIIEDDKLRTKLSKQAVSWADNFNWDKSYGEFKNLLI